MTWVPQPPPIEQCFETLNTALELGSNFWNGGELYGTPDYNSLHLLNKYFTQYPEKASQVVLSIKGGLKPDAFVIDGSEANIRRSVDECLRLLDGKKSIDIFECARQDPNTTVEQTVTILAQFVKEGKIGGIGLSEVDGATIRRAYVLFIVQPFPRSLPHYVSEDKKTNSSRAKVHPIAAVEVELSLWDTHTFDNDVIIACAELDIPLVAYSPLGRGVFSGAFTNASTLPEGDIRRWLPRFQDEAMEQNSKLVKEVQNLAERKGFAATQIALAWVLSLNDRPGMPTIIPIPGGTTRDKVRQNLQAPRLSDADMAELEEILQRHEVVGSRYP